MSAVARINDWCLTVNAFSSSVVFSQKNKPIDLVLRNILNPQLPRGFVWFLYKLPVMNIHQAKIWWLPMFWWFCWQSFAVYICQMDPLIGLSPRTGEFSPRYMGENNLMWLHAVILTLTGNASLDFEFSYFTPAMTECCQNFLLFAYNMFNRLNYYIWNFLIPIYRTFKIEGH